MSELQKSRVIVDFLLPEREVLQKLCDADLRPAAEQIRWLVLNEAQRRAGEIPRPMHSRSAMSDN